MLRKSALILLAATICFGTMSCRKSGCPAEIKADISKPAKKNKKNQGLFPKEMRP